MVVFFRLFTTDRNSKSYKELFNYKDNLKNEGLV